jgi:hypothetical protein
MSKRRLIFYNDSRHSHMYCYEPPMRLQDAQAPVDEIAGTGVDTLSYGFGLGPTMFHDTRVGEIMGSHLESFSQDQPNNLWALSSWRAYENVKSLIDRGLDPLNVIIDRAHEKGMEFIGSLRISHPSDPKDLVTAHNWQFKIDHPEWCLQGKGKHNFNWVHPEVRAERFALAEEAVTQYDLDGLEIDWVFAPYYFEEDEAAQSKHILTEFLRDVRTVVQKAAAERGRPISLGARVLPTLGGNLAAGLDVATWIGEGLLDFVVPNFYGDNQIDADFPFEWLVELAGPSGCEVYPALQNGVRALDIGDSRQDPVGVGDHPATVDQYRAAAAAYWRKGADAIYLPWFKWPQDAEQRQVLSEIHDPDLLKKKPKHYVVRRHYQKAVATAQGYAAETRGYAGQLKATLEAGMEAPGYTVQVYVADELDEARTWLKVRLIGSTALDSMTVSLNEAALPWETCTRTDHDGYYGTWLEFPLARGALRQGRNEVGVALHSRPPKLALPVLLESVDVIVVHPAPKSN